jgi:glycerate kinase
MHKGVAIIEMARASGLSLIGGPEHNDAIAASTTGVGELIDTALDTGVDKIIVCLGGSATTDGGYGAIRAIHAPARLRGVEFLVACDVDTLFTEAAEVFAPQKGATRTQVRLLTNRLERLAQMYAQQYGIDVSMTPGAGAAGGLAGGLMALGATLVPGFDLVADELGLHDAVRNADLVITGEGLLDETSFHGKVVGGVCDVAAQYEKVVATICGDIDAELPDDMRDATHPFSLVKNFGDDVARTRVLQCIEDAARQIITNVMK